MKYLTLMNKLEDKKALMERFEEKYGKVDAHIHFAGNAISYFDKLIKAADEAITLDDSIANPYAFLSDECNKVSDLKMRILEGLNWETSGIALGKENQSSNPDKELIFVVNFVNDKLEKQNFTTDIIHPNNPLIVTPIFIGPGGAAAGEYLAQIEPLDERFIAILPPEQFQDSTHNLLAFQNDPFSKGFDIVLHDYNLSFVGDVFDYHKKKKMIEEKTEAPNELTKGTNLKKKIRKSLQAAPLEENMEILLDASHVTFDSDIYQKGDIIAVASFDKTDALSVMSPFEMLNPCNLRGMEGVEETILDGVVYSTTTARVNLVFLRKGSVKILTSQHEIRV